MRDWMNDLWPASFAGTPFWIKKDDEQGGRRKKVHMFPRRDDPYIEDLGEAQRDFSIEAYVAGDTSDIDATAVVQAMISPDANLLVLPAQGPVLVQCHTFRRTRERDRMGLFAFELKFIRDGQSTAVVSTDFLGQMVFDAVDALAGAAVGLLGQLVM